MTFKLLSILYINVWILKMLHKIWWVFHLFPNL